MAELRQAIAREVARIDHDPFLCTRPEIDLRLAPFRARLVWYVRDEAQGGLQWARDAQHGALMEARFEVVSAEDPSQSATIADPPLVAAIHVERQIRAIASEVRETVLRASANDAMRAVKMLHDRFESIEPIAPELLFEGGLEEGPVAKAVQRRLAAAVQDAIAAGERTTQRFAMRALATVNALDARADVLGRRLMRIALERLRMEAPGDPFAVELRWKPIAAVVAASSTSA